MEVAAATLTLCERGQGTLGIRTLRVQGNESNGSITVRRRSVTRRLCHFPVLVVGHHEVGHGAESRIQEQK